MYFPLPLRRRCLRTLLVDGGNVCGTTTLRFWAAQDASRLIQLITFSCLPPDFNPALAAIRHCSIGVSSQTATRSYSSIKPVNGNRFLVFIPLVCQSNHHKPCTTYLHPPTQPQMDRKSFNNPESPRRGPQIRR